jgi:predicted metal-dependent hydrolase
MSQDELAHDPRYLVGVLLFNRQDYFEAHEAWEDLWSESHGAARKFYQGLIQASVGLCHFCNGNRNGAVKLYHSSRDYLSGCPSPFQGLDLADFARQMETCFHDLLNGADAEIDPDRLPEIHLDPVPSQWPDPAEYHHDED